jgi:hypothetical protein
MGGRTDKIENKQHPGNADRLYSLDGRMGVIETKATTFFTPDRRIRLKHPLSADQRRFIKEHGRRSSLSFVAVLLSRTNTEFQEAIFFRWNELDLLDHSPLETCQMLASWYGLWLPRTNETRQALRELLTGKVL